MFLRFVDCTDHVPAACVGHCVLTWTIYVCVCITPCKVSSTNMWRCEILPILTNPPKVFAFPIPMKPNAFNPNRKWDNASTYKQEGRIIQ